MPGIQIEVQGGWLPIGQPINHEDATLECAWQGTGAALITHERARQIEVEGYQETDAEYTDGELLTAAKSYIFLAEGELPMAEALWPWPKEYFRTQDDRKRALTKAGALIAAELDRIIAQDAQAGQQTPTTGVEF
jgi:hypothetical protein